MGWLALPMSYRTLVLQPHDRILFEGVGGTIRALDDLRIEARDGVTTVTWSADITLRGPLYLFDRLLQPMIRQVADDAMAGLQAWLGPVSR
jgi:carbon monoxide dehydrogenase subunit G